MNQEEKVTDKETEQSQADKLPDKSNSAAGSGTNPSGPKETKTGPKRPPKKQGRKKNKDDYVPAAGRNPSGPPNPKEFLQGNQKLTQETSRDAGKKKVR